MSTVTDQRRWDRNERVTYIRVPESDFPGGRTIAYAIKVHQPDDPDWWQVRTLTGATATIHSQHPSRVQAEEQLDQVTAWAAVAS